MCISWNERAILLQYNSGGIMMWYGYADGGLPLMPLITLDMINSVYPNSLGLIGFIG